MDGPDLTVKLSGLFIFVKVNRPLQKLLINWKYVSQRISAAFHAHKVDWVGRYINLLILGSKTNIQGGRGWKEDAGSVWLTFKDMVLLGFLNSN